MRSGSECVVSARRSRHEPVPLLERLLLELEENVVIGLPYQGCKLLHRAQDGRADLRWLDNRLDLEAGVLLRLGVVVSRFQRRFG